MKPRIRNLRLFLVVVTLGGTMGFAAVFWALLSVANWIGGVGRLREAVAAEGLTLWIWATPAPEPFEGPVYLMTVIAITAAVAVLAARLARRIVQGRDGTWPPGAMLWPITVSLGALLMMLLGDYPDDLRPSYAVVMGALTWKRYFVAWACAVVLAALPYLAVRVEEKLVLGRGPGVARSSIVWTVVLVASFLLVYEPGYPLQILHDSGYLAPVHQVSHGLTVYKEFASQYLFMGVYVLAALRKAGLLATDYHNFTFLLTLLWVGQIAVIFALIRRATRSDYWGVMCVFSVICTSVLSPWLSPVGIPNTGPLRWWGFYVLILLIAFFGWRHRSVPVVLAVLPFVELDVGLQAVLAYGLFRILASCLDFRERRRVVVDALLFCGVAGALLALVQAFVVWNTGQGLRVSEVFYTADKYARLGFGMIPVPFSTYLYLLVAINLAAITWGGLAIRRDALHGRRTRGGEHGHLLLFSGCLALVAALYYVGRSSDGNLYNVAPFSLLSLFLLLPLVFEGRCTFPRANHVPRLVTHLAIASLVISFPTMGGKVYVAEKLVRKAKAGLAGLLRIDDVVTPFVAADIELVRRNFPRGEPILWLGDDSGTFVLAHTGHRFLLYFSPHRWALTATDLRSALDRVVHERGVPQRIVVECSDGVRYALARQSGIVFATYDQQGRVHPTEAFRSEREEYERIEAAARQRCRGPSPPNYSSFLPNDLYQDKRNNLFNFAEAATAAFGGTYTLDEDRDCTGHNCLLRRIPG